MQTILRTSWYRKGKYNSESSASGRHHHARQMLREPPWLAYALKVLDTALTDLVHFRLCLGTGRDQVTHDQLVRSDEFDEAKNGRQVAKHRVHQHHGAGDVPVSHALLVKVEVSEPILTRIETRASRRLRRLRQWACRLRLGRRVPQAEHEGEGRNDRVEKLEEDHLDQHVQVLCGARMVALSADGELWSRSNSCSGTMHSARATWTSC